MGSSSDPIKLQKQIVRQTWLQSYPHQIGNRQNLSKLICQTLVQENSFINASQIALFAGREHEVDLFSLFELAPRTYAFPKVSPAKKEMHFFEISEPSHLEISKWGILEPLGSKTPAVEWTEQCLVLVPGVAFDISGNRIGSGAGYYDRFFSKNLSLRRWGICFEAQFHQRELAHTHHDVRMDAVITEKGIHYPKKGS